MKLKVVRNLSLVTALILIFTFLGTSNAMLGKSNNSTRHYELEKFTLSKGAVKESKFVSFAKIGATAKSKISYPNYQMVYLTFRYANGSKKASNFSVFINSKKQKIVLGPTGSLKTWKMKTIKTPFILGSNSVVIKSEAKTGCVNIDYITIKPVDKDLVVNIEANKKYQTIEGFGGYGAKLPSYLGQPIYDDKFVSDIVNDLGASILRVNIPTDMEPINDNADPLIFNADSLVLTGEYAEQESYIKAMKSAGITKFVAVSFSPPAWMKTNNAVNGSGVLKTECYEEYAEYFVNYIKTLKERTGISLYAMGLQLDPEAINDTSPNCYFTNQQLLDVIKVIGARFKKENITTKILAPESPVQSPNFDGTIMSLLNDSVCKSFIGGTGAHLKISGKAVSRDDWEFLSLDYYGKPVWITECVSTSNDWNAAMDLAVTMSGALKYSKANAWLWWEFSDIGTTGYGLMDKGIPTPLYYASKNFYKYIRPGSIQVKCTASGINSIAFTNQSLKTSTIILINTSSVNKKIDLSVIGSNFAKKYTVYRTSKNENCVNVGSATTENIILPSDSITTLSGEY